MGRWQEVCQRCSFGRQMYLLGWRWVVLVIWGGPIALIGLYDTAVGQGFLPDHFPRIGILLNNWNPNWFYIWLLLGALLFLVMTFESTYQIVRRKEGAKKAEIVVIPRVNYKRAKLEITNTGIDADFTATFKVFEGIPAPDLYTMCWEPEAMPTRPIAKDETASLLVGEISPDTIQNSNIVLTVFRDGLALFYLDGSEKKRIGASTEKTIETRKLNQRYPTMRTTYENRCTIEITITAVPSLTIPFDKRKYSLEIDETNHLLFSEVNPDNGDSQT